MFLFFPFLVVSLFCLFFLPPGLLVSLPPRLMKMYRGWRSLCSDGWRVAPSLPPSLLLTRRLSCLPPEKIALPPPFLPSLRSSCPPPFTACPSPVFPSFHHDLSCLSISCLRHFDNNCSTSVMTFLSCHPLLSRFFSPRPPSLLPSLPPSSSPCPVVSFTR